MSPKGLLSKLPAGSKVSAGFTRGSDIMRKPFRGVMVLSDVTGDDRCYYLVFTLIRSEEVIIDNQRIKNYEEGAALTLYMNFQSTNAKYNEGTLQNFVRNTGSLMGIHGDYEWQEAYGELEHFKNMIGNVYIAEAVTRNIKAEKDKYYLNFTLCSNSANQPSTLYDNNVLDYLTVRNYAISPELRNAVLAKLPVKAPADTSDDVAL